MSVLVHLGFSSGTIVITEGGETVVGVGSTYSMTCRTVVSIGVFSPRRSFTRKELFMTRRAKILSYLRERNVVPRNSEGTYNSFLG